MSNQFQMQPIFKTIIESIRNVIGSKNSRELKRKTRIVDQINELAPRIKTMPLQELKDSRIRLNKLFLDGKKALDILPEAFAICRETSERVLGLRHFDVQLIGGITLFEGCIAEMRTGEGKTLVATLPVYLNAITDNSTHVVTVNEYLANRDASWMGPLYEALGLSVGVIKSGQTPEEKKTTYGSDVTYGTNNEFGFDYLRDNMAFSLETKTQKKLSFAIVDEVDSILIDEARTPLIISGPTEDHSLIYKTIDEVIPFLTRAEKNENDNDEQEFIIEGHYLLDEKNRSVELTELGHEMVETKLVESGLLKDGDSLYNPINLALFHHVNAGLRAHTLFQKNVHYIVQNNQVVIVDEHTGRTMSGRRWSEGLHQAVEAKEKVDIQLESQTLASTTFQNYFRLYDRLAGMTGTADTEAYEFRQIYGLDVVVIPTNVESKRIDYDDSVFLTLGEKIEAIIKDIKKECEIGRPVLVGTASIESSELLSDELRKQNITHNVLNAKQHEREAEIIAQAGRPGAITIATNMAGRGTDIVLGGNLKAELLDCNEKNVSDEISKNWEIRHKQVINAGGLHIIGSERHESRRIDNQLRGRSGRQGDPGSSRFFLSLEDDLMRIFASPKMKSIMQGLGMERGESIEHKMVSNAIEKAQKKVEGRNFDIRKQLLDYDDVANDQRTQVYAQRAALIESKDLTDVVERVRDEILSESMAKFIPPESLIQQWNIDGLEAELSSDFGIEIPIKKWLEEDSDLYEETLRERILSDTKTKHEDKSKIVGSETMRRFEKQILLQVLDHQWKEHLAAMDYLRQGIHLRGYAQKNPKQEYKKEAFELFSSMLSQVKRESIRILTSVKVPTAEEIEAEERQRKEAALQAILDRQKHHFDETQNNRGVDVVSKHRKPENVPRKEVNSTGRNSTFISKKVGRNEPCPCNSGKKFKHCHGKL